MTYLPGDTIPSAAETERRERRRRQEDLQLVNEVTSFARNRVTQRIALILLPILAAGCTIVYTQWKAIPSVTWQNDIVNHQEEAQRQYVALLLKINGLETKVNFEADLSQQQREEIKQELKDIRKDLQRWFEGAGAVPSPRR